MIQVKNACKSFQLNKKEAKKQGRTRNVAVDAVSFICESGEVLALLGSNGAGKTTTLRLLSTALEVDSGEIWIDDIAVHKFPRQARKKIGFLSNNTPLYRRLTVRENLMFFGQLYGLEKAYIDQRISTLSQELSFETYLDQKVDSLSTGMAQKASIVRSIIHEPDVIILDEPTTGLDVEASQQILEFILLQKSLNKSIIFSTHHMNEVELLASSICLIQNGKTNFTGSVAEAKAHTGHDNLTQVFLSLIGKEVA
jgi:sodium transport system ATP-binding protein